MSAFVNEVAPPHVRSQQGQWAQQYWKGLKLELIMKALTFEPDLTV